MANELMVIDNKLMEMGYSAEALAELTPEEKHELAEALNLNLQEALEGADFKPIRLKINREIQQFSDTSGELMKELKGVIVYNHKARGHWPKGGGEIPECSSNDGNIGIVTETGEKRECAACPFNQWGSAENDDGSQSRGKACKEMRRLYIDLEKYSLPVILSLPPTSINEFDNYVSVMTTKGIPLLIRETKITLNKEKRGGYDVAVAKFEIGDPVEPKRALELSKLRKEFKEYASKQQITLDDYGDTDTTTAPESNVNLDDIA